MIKVTPEEFQAFAKYIHGLTGISLDQSKVYLVETRFGGLLQEFGCASYSELYFKAKSDPSKAIEKKIIDAITTGETLFFRDASPFDLLQHKLLPDLIDRRAKRLPSAMPIPIRIWSAACSTGQEVYSIAMVLRELLGDTSKYNIKLVGTDISDAAVARASYGRYNKFEMDRGMPKDKLLKYFTAEKDSWRIRDDLRAMASFRKLNLMEPFGLVGKFDIIFCRNVAIYFNEADRARLFSRLGEVLEPDGCLVIGATESLSGICPQFAPQRYLRSVFYQLAPAQTPLRAQAAAR